MLRTLCEREEGEKICLAKKKVKKTRQRRSSQLGTKTRSKMRRGGLEKKKVRRSGKGSPEDVMGMPLKQKDRRGRGRD